MSVRDIVRRTDGSVVPRGRLGTVVCCLSENAGGLLAVKWDDDKPYRSMAVTGSSVEVLR
jgi:hypothetical protein